MAHDVTETNKKSLVGDLIGKVVWNSWSIVTNVSGMIISVTGLVTLTNKGYLKFMENKGPNVLKSLVTGSSYDIGSSIDKIFNQEVGEKVLEGKYNMPLAMVFGVAYCAWHLHKSPEVVKVEIIGFNEGNE